MTTKTDTQQEAAAAGATQNGQRPQQSLDTRAARNLATTTKTVPQMQGISTRWLLRVLPWVEAKGGTYRVNRRFTYKLGDGRVTFSNSGAEIRVVPGELRELAWLREFDDESVLKDMANRFEQHDYEPGAEIVRDGQPVDHVYLIAHGKVNKIRRAKFGDETVDEVLTDGDHFGGRVLSDTEQTWDITIRALTPTTVLSLSRQSYQQLLNKSKKLKGYVDQQRRRPDPPRNQHGEAEVHVASGHEGESELPGTFVDYELSPREYQLSVAQTVLRVHTRVADLFSEPMDQTEQQLRLTIEALRERQENELVNNSGFGLLHNADLKQRIPTHKGAPTPDDMDELLSVVWKDPSVLLAHPRTIAAFGRECNRRGVYPQNVDLNGHQVPAWRGIPLLPCNKIPISKTQTSSVLAMRLGEANQGVVGLHATGLPDEYQPGLSVRFMGINSKAVISYLVSAYYSAAVLVPDALGILEDAEIGREVED